MIIHFPGLKHGADPGILLFPKLLVCSDCGVSEFTVPAKELVSLSKTMQGNKSYSLKSAGDGGLYAANNCFLENT